MKTTTLVLSLAAALSLTLAGCNRNTERTPTPKTSTVEPGGVQQPRTATPATPSQPATTGAPVERSGAGSTTGNTASGGGASAENKTPTTIDGQVDASHGPQHKDFQHPATGGK
jgi:hypothetical protein